jgi:hypothetical protein
MLSPAGGIGEVPDIGGGGGAIDMELPLPLDRFGGGPGGGGGTNGSGIAIGVVYCWGVPFAAPSISLACAASMASVLRQRSLL